MKKTAWVVLSAITCLVAALRAQQNEAMNAAEIVNTAVTKNHEFLALLERTRETEALLRQAGLRPFPTLEVNGATGRPLGTVGEEEYSAGYFQPIETGGKRLKRISVAQFSVQLSRAEIDEKQRQLTFDVRSRYAEAVAAYRKLEAARALLRIDRENYDLTNARVRAGDAAALEAALFLTEAGKTQAQEVGYNARLSAAMSELRRIAGLNVAEPLQIRFDFTPIPALPPLADLQRRSNDRADIRLLRISERQTEAAVELARAEGKPDLTASARYARRDSRFNAFGLSASGATVPLRDRDDILSFGISIPILTGSRNRGNVEAAVARAAGAEQRRAFLEGVIPQEVESAYRRLVAAKQVIDLLVNVLDQSEANLKVIREAYTLGQLRVLDVLNEQRRLVDVRLSYIDAEMEAEQAQVELERAVGGPIQ